MLFMASTPPLFNLPESLVVNCTSLKSPYLMNGIPAATELKTDMSIWTRPKQSPQPHHHNHLPHHHRLRTHNRYPVPALTKWDTPIQFTPHPDRSDEQHMPRQTEPNANNALGSLLQNMLSRGQVRSENTRAITGQPGLRPDIIITAPGRSPVVIEAEYMPARTVEPEATSRLGLEVAAKWCAEPSVHGGKARPRGAKLVK